jgi:hypothetical protein
LGRWAGFSKSLPSSSKSDCKVLTKTPKPFSCVFIFISLFTGCVVLQLVIDIKRSTCNKVVTENGPFSLCNLAETTLRRRSYCNRITKRFCSDNVGLWIALVVALSQAIKSRMYTVNHSFFMPVIVGSCRAWAHAWTTRNFSTGMLDLLEALSRPSWHDAHRCLVASSTSQNRFSPQGSLEAPLL